MPYIKPEQRPDIDKVVNSLNINDCGQLNYAITTMIHKYLKEKGIKYSNINEVIGILECAKLELYRRVASPYEDEKINENGDVI